MSTSALLPLEISITLTRRDAHTLLAVIDEARTGTIFPIRLRRDADIRLATVFSLIAEALAPPAGGAA